MRVFIAIEMSKEAKKKILEIEKNFSSFPLAFVKKENLHLTLAFLGEVSLENINSIIQIMENLAKKTPCFNLKFSKLGAFPNFKLPKVIWIGLENNLETLFNLEKNLKTELLKNGFFIKEKKFVPHITFGRIKSFANKKIRRHLGEQVQRFGRIEPLEINCDAISIFKSTPTSNGYIHELINKIPLVKNG